MVGLGLVWFAPLWYGLVCFGLIGFNNHNSYFLGYGRLWFDEVGCGKVS